MTFRCFNFGNGQNRFSFPLWIQWKRGNVCASLYATIHERIGHLPPAPGHLPPPSTTLTLKKVKVAHTRLSNRVPELIAVLGSQPARDVSHKPGGRLPLLSTRPAVTPATLKRVDTNFVIWWV